MRTRWSMTSASLGFIVLAFLLILSDGAPKERSAPDANAPPEQRTPPPAPERFGAVVEGEFRTDADEPAVLWAEEGDVIYVRDLRLIYRSEDGSERLLYEWRSDLRARAWRNGSHLLVGAQLPEPADPNDWNRGSWISVHADPARKALELGTNFFGPDEVLTVTVTEKPRLYFVKMKNGTSFSEYMYDPDGAGWLTVNSDTLDGDGSREMPEKAEGTRRFDDVREIRLPEGMTVYSFADEEGGIVYYRRPFEFVWRYVGYEMVDAKLMPLANGESLIFGRFRGHDGEDAMSFPNWGSRSALPAELRLWEDGWTAIDFRHFARVSPERLELIRYQDGSTLQDNAPEYWSFDTSEARLVSVQGALAEYEKGGEPRYISLYDAMHTEGNDGKPPWVSPLRRFTTESRPRTQDAVEFRTLTIPEPVYGDNTNAPVPDVLRRAVDDVHEVVDYVYAYTYRKLGDRWFVLVDRHFYEYKDGALEPIGEAPVTVAATIGEGFEGLGAMDFVRIGDAWVFADTNASRVLKLNNALEVVAELALPHPFSISAESDRLRIASLSGETVTDFDLNVVAASRPPFESIADAPKTAWEHFRKQEIYEDSETGLLWYYLYGRIYQYRTADQTLRSFYVGHRINARSEVRIPPYRDELMVLFDHKLERFRRDGDWIGTIPFPRSRPDGIYDTTPAGEGSIDFDEAAGLLYLVQGYRIVEIDLERNEARTLFRQNYADLGELVRHGEHLYFLLRGNLEDRYRYYNDRSLSANGKLVTEVVRLDPRSGEHARFMAKGFYETLEMNDDGTGDAPQMTLIVYE